MSLMKKDQLNLKQFSLNQDERKYSILDYNFKLLLLVVAAIAMGTIIIVSVDETKLTKQLIGAGACILGMIIVSLIDYNFICKYYMVLYFINLALLGLILVIGSGSDSHGASRWFAISDSFTIQPSEFSKIILIICSAVFLEKHIDDLNKARTLLKLALFLAIPVGLIFVEPDLSTTICLCATLFVVIFIAGLSLKLIGIAVLILIPCFGGFFWYIQQDNLPQILNAYQRTRILGHMYGSEYGSTQDQQNNSIMAIGSGQLTGKGINSSDVATVKDTNLISEQQTDFIFSAVGEELGFIGSVIIIAILLLIVLQCIRIARHSSDRKGMFIATGMAALVSIQAFINIGVATSILPNTGLPLPFISYGLSSLVSLCAGMGMVLNINLQKKKY
ncbi:MAG: FtsW/RodA/SpoVE family cell cycle protein [Clostridiales bacterium]|nr:FtsW/RodA/SpoVE family cell cycle protein [Clostridiales bacterium]